LHNFIINKFQVIYHWPRSHTV